jgi:two-component system LytT family response regulator
MRRPLRAYLVDDIEAANLRLARVLEETGRVEVVGSTTQPLLALAEIPERDVDVLFLDIEMPGLDGFELLRRLPGNPQVVFVTGHEEHARRAFDERAVDYLMKPVVRERLAQTLDSLEARRADPGREVLAALLKRLEGYQPSRPSVPYAERVRVELGQGGFDVIEVATISHFVAQGRGTLAMTAEGSWLVDHALGELESRLNPRDFYRIHRNTIVNLNWVRRVEPPRSGGLVVKLKDKTGTELEVARERIRELRERFI